MSVNIACPNCHEIYEDQDDSVLGTDVECECGHVFVAKRIRAERTQFTKTPRKKSATPPRAAEPADHAKRGPRVESSKTSSVNSAVWLAVTVVVGAATAFGALYALGFLSTDDGQPQQETVNKTSTTRNSKDIGRIAMHDGRSVTKTRDLREPTEKSSRAISPPKEIVPPVSDVPEVDPPSTTKTESPDPTIPEVVNVEPPVVPSGQPSGQSVARTYTLLEVAPFATSNSITAKLRSVVAAEIQSILDARKLLIEVMDAQVVALATAGKVADIQKLRAAKKKVELGDVSSLNDLGNDAITMAQAAYAAAVNTPKDRLTAEYGAAITQAREQNDVELQRRLTQERDAGFELPAHVWTVVFRSSDPGRWNIGTSDGDHLSLNLSSIPDSVRSLRLRRMDNGATVVIAMTKAWLTDEHTDTAAKIGWMAKNSDFWKSKRLGVFRTDEEIRDAPQGSVFVSSGSFSRGYAGWGFGHTDNRWNSPQGFTWNGQSLGPTVFEIAVSDAPLESITPFSLRVNSPTTATATPTELPSDNPVVAQLETAKSDHQAAVATARQKVLQSIDASLQELGAKGDADGIEKLAAARKEFEEHDAVRTVSNTLRSKLVSFQSEINRADQNLLKAYTRAVAAFKREQNEDLVTLLSNQIEEGVGYEAERWIVLFSSPNPSLWNTRSRGPFKFARPATDAPIDLKYLRMRVISAKSGDKTPPVICKMTKDRLVRQSDMDGVGWNGLKVQDHNAVHLGMYLVDKAVKFPAPRNTQGLVSVWDQGFTGHLGWGFGHHIRVDKVQGYSWGGLTSPQPLQVEIAVSSKPLRDHEWKVLQGGTTP